VNRVDDLGAAGARPSHVITVYGADHPGIVHAVSATLAERGVNITGLETRLAGAEGSPLYVMIIEVAIPEESDGELESVLSDVGDRTNVEVSLRPLAAEAL
jgi:glycine cleavage system transcriptional repressor